MSLLKKMLILWLIIFVVIICVDIFIYYDVVKMDTNQSQAIEVYSRSLPEFQFRLITLDNITSILTWGTIIVMGFVTFGLIKVYQFFDY